jgi:hypothetical protein
MLASFIPAGGKTMNLAALISRFVLVAAALAVPTQASLAQAQQQKQQPPAREDNVWGGVAHQPTEPQVLQQEKAAGVSQSPQQQKATNQDVEQLYQNLINNTPSGRTTP